MPADGSDLRGPRKAEQLPLDLGHGVASTREDLIVSDPVSAAIGIIDQWPAWQSPVVVICGPSGSGKSHIASIWRERSEACAAMIAEDAPEIDYDAFAGRHVLIEDLDRTPFNETALFHLINLARQQSTTVLITSRRWPATWPLSLADLKSRLKAATVVEIGEPDDDLLAQVLVKLFADRQIAIEPRVVNYCVTRMERSLDFAERLAGEIDRLALARRARISTAIAGEALANLAARAGHDGDE